MWQPLFLRAKEVPGMSTGTFIAAQNAAHEFFRRDEKGNVTAIIRALDDVNMEVRTGDFIVIAGRNGSGKSTFAKHLNRLLVPTEGTVVIDNIDTSDRDKDFEIKQRVGMVFQNPDNQMVANVVKEDVGFGPENLGVPAEEIRLRVENALAAVGMTAYASHAPERLSGGQKQRVAIAGVLAMRPKCIVLDEATAMLDPVGRTEVLRVMRMLHEREGITVILITHHMEEAVYADKMFVMDKGRVVMEGTPEEIFTKGAQVREYGLELPQAVLLAERLREKGILVGRNILGVEDLVRELERVKEHYAVTI